MFYLDDFYRFNEFWYFRIVSESSEKGWNAYPPFSSNDLDNYVQNIHLLHHPPSISSRPKRIRKRKKFYIEESELPSRPKKLKTPIRKKNPPPAQIALTDAEIEQQFGERLPIIKSEHDDDNNRVVMEFEPVPQTPIEKARASLTTALGRKIIFIIK